MRICSITFIAALALHALSAQAHGIWFAQRADRLALVYGDGAEDLDLVKRLPKINSVGGVGGDGQAVAVTLEPEGRVPFVSMANKPLIVTATMNNGLWSKSPDGTWHGKGKDEVTNARTSGLYLKYASHLVALPGGPVAPVQNMALQIVPISAKFPRHKDEVLTVRVLFEGKPLPGAKVWQDIVTDPDGNPLVADKEGRVTLPVRNQGLNVLAAEHESAPMDSGKADMTHHFATLSFILEHAPE
jgi:nickel transport protein